MLSRLDKMFTRVDGVAAVAVVAVAVVAVAVVAVFSLMCR